MTPAKKLGAGGIAAIVVGGVLLACCGFAGLGALVGDEEPEANASPSLSPSSTAVVPTADPLAAVSASPSIVAEPSRTIAAPKPKPTTAAPQPKEPYYRNCDAVRAAGKDPLYEGDPGFRPALDRDGDGEACEPDGGNGDTGPAPDGDVYYANCSAVRAAGAAPIRKGDPGYSRKLDRDGDGIACE
ncbi:excalibur calcium-binding domain-containing protein [Micromonospora sp. KC721]|uniref:excalibur calcium-binding domain-containing protein n=1 Tax=Micromonospora sp. KC721 TaxID=2530380 RepID=UPI001053C8E6|nr:excalibur calcium-binding domain-containing protein [Micromonospora sp. KC721]TDB79862.1 excalibur calcium-binding domain-containing protein [Micromonospora sp. KC721]